jgi:hypothetical protein
MSTTPSVHRDERTVAVENAGYRWAYLLVSFALLVDVGYRGVVRHEAAWDLLALVILGGVVCAVHQARQKALPDGSTWMPKAALIALVAGAVGAAVAVALTLLSRM